MKEEIFIISVTSLVSERKTEPQYHPSECYRLVESFLITSPVFTFTISTLRSQVSNCIARPQLFLLPQSVTRTEHGNPAVNGSFA